MGKEKIRPWGGGILAGFVTMKRDSSGGERGKGGAGMAVEVAQRTMEAYVKTC
jgi:hypothetical protein